MFDRLYIAFSALLPHTAIDGVLAFVIGAGAVASALTGKLTPWAAFAGALTGWVIYRGAGTTGLIILGLFFIAGTLATSWRRKEKNQFDPEGAGAVKRKTGQVLANGGTAALLSLAALLLPEYGDGIRIMVAASLASATADTLSSELGVLYGRRFYNCLTWRQDTKGRDGVISLEGTCIGIAGAAMIAIVYILMNNSLYSPPSVTISDIYPPGFIFFIIVISGAIGNLADSILGASLERKGYLSNDFVNFLSTATAALAAALSI